MNELKIFTNSTFGNVRVIKQNGEQWFVAKDVCDCLDISNSRQALSRLDNDEKNSVILNDGIPGNPEKSIVNEYGLYNLVLSSRKPEAKEFKRWITHDVIPSIRQHGAYMTIDTVERAMNDPDFIIGLLTNFKQIKTEKEQALKQIEADKPKVLFADTVSASHTSILIGELAKIMKQAGLNIGQNRLFERLRQDGYLISRKGTDYNMPTQKAMDLKLFEIKETTVSHADGHISVNKTPKVTGKGQQYFINRYLGQCV